MSTATRAIAFTNSIGIQIHDGYTQSWSPYASAATVTAALAYLNPNGIGTGASTVRDESSAPAAALMALGKLGYKLDIYASYNSGNNTASSAINLLTPLVNAGYVRMIEGPLEVDNAGWGLIKSGSYTALNGSNYTGWQAAVEWQKDLYSTFSGKTQIALFSLANPSDGAATSPAVQAAAQLGVSLGSISNLGNVHFYEHNGNAPAAELPGVIAQETGYTPHEGFVITETGFNDDTSGSAASVGYHGTANSNGAYTLDLVLDAFKAGSSLTDLYELFDENNPNFAAQGIAFENHWGLFNSNGTPKPAATDLHNMMAVLGDKGSTAASFTPGSLNYTVSGLAANGKSLLLQKSDGAFDIAVWADANINTNGVTTTAPTQNVTVNLGGTYGTVKVFDPVQASSAIKTLTNVSSVTLGITDHPLIIEVEPSGAAATPPAPTPPAPTPVPPVPTPAPPVPTPAPKPAESANNTVVKAGSTAAITDANGNAWTITSGGKVAVNGSVDAITSGVTELAYVSGKIWQQAAGNLWWGETLPNDSWAPTAGTTVSPLLATPSANGTMITSATAPSIIDHAGNAWSLVQSAAKGLQIAVNGVVDSATSKVTLLETLNGKIVQENAAGNWYSEPGPKGPWTQIVAPTIGITNNSTGATTTVSGATVATTTAAGATFVLSAPGVAKVTLGIVADTIKFAGMSSVTLAGGSGAATITADGGNNSFTGGSGALAITGGVGADAYTYHAANKMMTVNDFSLAKGDSLTVDKTLQGSMTQQADGHGGLSLGFGAANPGVHLVGVASIAPGQIHFV